MPSAHAAWENGNWSPIFTATNDIDYLDVCSDGGEGTLAITMDPDPYPRRATFTKLSRSGSEIWGNDGRWVEIDLSSGGQSGPVAIAPDGAGGAFCAYLENYTTTSYLHLVRRDASGNFVWAKYVDNVGPNPASVGVKLLDEPGVGVNLVYANGTGQRLLAARYDNDGNLLWGDQVNDFYAHNAGLGPASGYAEFDARSDGQGGVLVGWIRYDPVEYQQNGVLFEQVGAQKLDSSGARQWGSDGVLIWAEPYFPEVSIYHARIVRDGAGGAYLITSGGLRAYGQHLNSVGTPTWGSGGIVVQATPNAGPNADSEPEIVSDESGGFILVQSDGNIYAQRMGSTGNKLWGPDGLTIAQVDELHEYFDKPALDADAFGGALVGWNRWVDGAESLCGLRIDANGTTLWYEEHLFDAPSNESVHDIHVVADGHGSGQFVWQETDASGNDDVYALGVDLNGQPPQPFLYGVIPESGEPGEVGPVAIFGDYLDASYTYQLRHSGSVAPITSPVALNSGLVLATGDLTGAPLGRWDLAMAQGTSDKSTVIDAFGVGNAPPCDQPQLLAAHTEMLSFGSMRKCAFDHEGNVRAASIYQEAGTGDFILALWTIQLPQMTASSHELQRFGPSEQPTDLAFAIDDADRSVVSYVVPNEGVHLERYVPPPQNDYLDGEIAGNPTGSYSNPTLAIDGSGDPHVIVEYGPSGSQNFLHLFGATGGYVWGYLVIANNTHAPELIRDGDDLRLAYVCDSNILGLQDIRTVVYHDGSWQSSLVQTYGLDLSSPTLAWDGANTVLLAWIVDNSGNGSASTLMTTRISGSVTDPPKLRSTDGYVYRVEAGAAGKDAFTLLTQETGSPMQIFVRSTDGYVLYPKKRINAFDESDWPSLAVQPGGERTFALWTNYNHPESGTSWWSWYCELTATAAPSILPRPMNLTLRAAPNPFNPRTVFSFDLSREQWVKLAVYDLHGRRVRQLVDGLQPAGTQHVSWNGIDDRGTPVASGTYIARMETVQDGVSVTKVALVK
jgi:hypothetical protein